MSVQLKIVGKHPALSTSEVRRVVLEVSREISGSDLDRPAPVRILGGGFSGSLVVLAWLPEHEPLVIKAGPAADIKREQDTRIARSQGLVGGVLGRVFGPWEVEVADRAALWSAICYQHVGSRTYEDLEHYGDFAHLVTNFVDPEELDTRPNVQTVRACMRAVAQALVRGIDVVKEARGRDLSQYLPTIDWADDLRASLMVASSLWPDVEELRNFQEWYEAAVDSIRLAPVGDQRVLHGDARLANILVDAVHASIHLIDFGNGRTGHIFEDLVRFELDLILSTGPRHADDCAIVQDDLLDTFGLALTDDFKLSGVPNDAPAHARCLKIWRGELASTLPGVALPGALLMYRWFLLAECLRRLRWVGRNGAKAAGIDAPSLLRLISLLRRRLSGGQSRGGVPIATPADALRVLHCAAAFVPTRGRERSVNEKRNLAKKLALSEAATRASTIRVLAETGQSYLSTRGVFSNEVRDLLAGGGCLQMVICNPHFIEASGLSLSYDPGDGHSELWPAIGDLHPDLSNKFVESIRGFQVLRGEFGQLAQLRLAHFGIGATMLLSDDSYFYEPYFHTRRHRRHKLLFDTFELQFDASSLHIRTLVDETFDFHWKNSDDATDIRRLGERCTVVRNQVLEMWKESRTSLAEPPSH